MSSQGEYLTCTDKWIYDLGVLGEVCDKGGTWWMNFWLIVLEICCGIFIQLPLRIGEEIQEEEYHFLEEKAKHLPKYISSILVLLKISLSGLRLSWERWFLWQLPGLGINQLLLTITWVRPPDQTHKLFIFIFHFDQPNQCPFSLWTNVFSNVRCGIPHPTRWYPSIRPLIAYGATFAEDRVIILATVDHYDHCDQK